MIYREEFIRNNRGINDNADLPAAYLEELYDNIKAEQIRVSAISCMCFCMSFVTCLVVGS